MLVLGVVESDPVQRELETYILVALARLGVLSVHWSTAHRALTVPDEFDAITQQLAEYLVREAKITR